MGGGETPLDWGVLAVIIPTKFRKEHQKSQKWKKLKIIFELKIGPDVNAQPEKSNEKVNGDIYISYNSQFIIIIFPLLSHI